MRPLKKLGPVHWQAIALRLSGLTIREVAERIHRSPATVASWFEADPLVRAAYAAQREELIARARDVLAQAAPAAASRLAELLRAESEQAALGAANSILDRAGLKPATAHTGPDGGPLRIVIEYADDHDGPGA